MLRVLHPGISLANLCQLFGKSRQGYYQSRQFQLDRSSLDAIVSQLVIELRIKIGNHKIGGRKLLPLINEQLAKSGLQIGRDRLFDIMEANDLKVRRRKRKRPITTNSRHGFKRYNNLIKNLAIKQAEQVWVSDITYIHVAGKFMYLSLITDAYSRKIVGYCLHEDLSTQGTLQALLMALTNRYYPNRSLIHHSDQGTQYCSHQYVSMLKTHDVAISMAHKGSPHENALAERVNGILKQEYGLGKSIDNQQKAIQMVNKAIESYNCKRPHNSLAGQTPNQIHGNVLWKQDLEEDMSSKNRTKIKEVTTNQD